MDLPQPETAQEETLQAVDQPNSPQAQASPTPREDAQAADAQLMSPQGKPVQTDQADNEAALKATQAFFQSVAQAIPSPLAPKTARPKQNSKAPMKAPGRANNTSQLRRSGRLAKGELNSAAFQARGGPHHEETGHGQRRRSSNRGDQRSLCSNLHQASDQKKHLRAIRDLFPITETLTDKELSATLLAGELGLN